MTGLPDELIGKKCVFDLGCDDNYRFHYAVVAHIEKVQNHKRVDSVARSPLSGFFLTNPVKGGRVGPNFVPQFKGGLDLSMLTAPMPDPCNDSTALQAFGESNNISVYV